MTRAFAVLIILLAAIGCQSQPAHTTARSGSGVGHCIGIDLAGVDHWVSLDSAGDPKVVQSLLATDQDGDGDIIIGILVGQHDPAGMPEMTIEDSRGPSHAYLLSCTIKPDWASTYLIESPAAFAPFSEPTVREYRYLVVGVDAVNPDGAPVRVTARWLRPPSSRQQQSIARSEHNRVLLGISR